jgi:hypothetical protein
VSFWSRDIFTGACPECRASGARPATLGCGTLLLIGIVVAIFSRGGTGDLEREVHGLRSEVGDLKKAVEAQSSEIRQLRDRLPPPAKANDDKAKE